MTALSDAARAELSPTGVLRIAIAVGAARSALWAAPDDQTGRPAGVTVDLGAALAAAYELPFEYVVHSSSGHIVDGADKGVWDVTFVPVDAERKARLDFGPNYYFGDSTYLVRDSSGIESVAQMNREDLTIVGIEGTATLRSARRTSRARIIGVEQVSEALRAFEAREADAIALGRESLNSLQLPDTRILEDNFHATGTAVAVPLGRASALAAVSSFIETSKADDTLRAIFARNGLSDTSVAPIGSRS